MRFNGFVVGNLALSAVFYREYPSLIPLAVWRSSSFLISLLRTAPGLLPTDFFLSIVFQNSDNSARQHTAKGLHSKCLSDGCFDSLTGSRMKRSLADLIRDIFRFRDDRDWKLPHPTKYFGAAITADKNVAEIL